MEPQKKERNQIESDKIISLMRVTKKSDPLFKPLKKLKNALESVGYASVSWLPTRTILLFHFGLGNDVDLQFIKLTALPQLEQNPIIPGKAFCIINFPTEEEATKYLQTGFKIILQELPIRCVQLQYQNMNRLLLAMYCSRNFFQQHSHSKAGLHLALENCSSVYLNTIPGIQVVENFITEEEQMKLLKSIDANKWERLNNRRVQHYGYEFKYGRNQIDKDQLYENPMPQFILPMLNKIAEIKSLPMYVGRFDQMTINDYFPGDGIPSHFDTHSPFEQVFVAISLLSGLTMQFRKFDGTESQVYLAPRSLIVFAGQGRYAWTHGISCRKIDKIDSVIKHRGRRLSITLRKIRYDPCQCPYYFYCDSQGYDQKSMKRKNHLLEQYLFKTGKENKLESLIEQAPLEVYQKYVRQAYNSFGYNFHNKVVGGIEKYIVADLVKGKDFIFVLDVGCGNGEYYNAVIQPNDAGQMVYYTGIQLCQIMDPCQNKIHMDGLHLAFREAIFDSVLCIAVLHHMPSRESRLKMLSQICRVLITNGSLYLSVFDYNGGDGEKSKEEIYGKQDILLQYCVPEHKIKQEQSEQGQKKGPPKQAARIQRKGEVYERYYHLFTKDEVSSLLLEAGFQIVQIFAEKQNIIVKATKKNTHAD